MRKFGRLLLMVLVSVLLPLALSGYYFMHGRYYLGALGAAVVLINCVLQWRRRVPLHFGQIKGGRRG